MRGAQALVTIAGVAVAAACGSKGSTGPEPGNSGLVVYAAPNLTFQPDSIQIVAGNRITWNFGAVAHTVTFAHTTPGQSYPADIPLTMNDSIPRVFGSSGVYVYHCTVHPTMTGKVVVLAP